ncbi:MAG: Na+/H+ antiporter NhaA [Myxococcales bacterium]|nr:Na+/H+ antiporter NhaA [Myxococcales bacterium]MDH3483214.1 Na+/H+ antiporter NhaA [Myxococcales bacterium]
MSVAQSSGTRGVFARFVHSEATASIILLACTIAALAWANSPWAESYFRLGHIELGFKIGHTERTLSLHDWINDFLMAIFFFVVGLEIKREMVVGALSTFKTAALPVAAALGGMIAPAVIYFTLNPRGEASHGWGVPMATDIAFALGVLALFGKRVPIGLKVFLTALAIADDLGAVLVIALFYTSHLDFTELIAAGSFLFLIVLASRFGIRSPALYIILALGVWVDVFASGIHATVAGVLLAMLMPVRAGRDPEHFFREVKDRFEALRASQLTRDSMIHDRTQLDAISNLRRAAQEMQPPGLIFEELLHPFVVFFILPLFAFFNAGVRIDGSIANTLLQPVSLGVGIGLVFGKQIGITLFSWLAVKSGKAALPAGVGWGELYGAACLGGIGFTMSLFISELAFETGAFVAEAKIGILAASLLAAIWGSIVLFVRLRR